MAKNLYNLAGSSPGEGEGAEMVTVPRSLLVALLDLARASISGLKSGTPPGDDEDDEEGARAGLAAAAPRGAERHPQNPAEGRKGATPR